MRQVLTESKQMMESTTADEQSFINKSYFGLKFQDYEDTDNLRLPNSELNHFSNSKSND